MLLYGADCTLSHQIQKHFRPFLQMDSSYELTLSIHNNVDCCPVRDLTKVVPVFKGATVQNGANYKKDYRRHTSAHRNHDTVSLQQKVYKINCRHCEVSYVGTTTRHMLIVYKVNCPHCEVSYVGMTTRHMLIVYNINCPHCEAGAAKWGGLMGL